MRPTPEDSPFTWSYTPPPRLVTGVVGADVSVEFQLEEYALRAEVIRVLEDQGYTVIAPIEQCSRCQYLQRVLPDWSDDQIRTVHWNSAHGRK